MHLVEILQETERQECCVPSNSVSFWRAHLRALVLLSKDFDCCGKPVRRTIACHFPLLILIVAITRILPVLKGQRTGRIAQIL